MDDAPILASDESLSTVSFDAVASDESLAGVGILVESSSVSDVNVSAGDAIGADAVPSLRIVAEDESAEPASAVDRPGSEKAELPIGVIEALLFASDAPLSAARLVELLGAGTQGEVRRGIEKLNARYASADMSFRVEEIARGYQMMTLAEYRPYVAKLNKQASEARLSDATLEALAIVAYKQPIIRADVEAIRGVACGEVLNRLREMGLVKIVGRAEVVGRPMLYGTTRRFLDMFGLADLDDLPPMESLKLRPKVEAAEPAVEPRAAAGGS